MGGIRVAIAGLGNCASSLVQGIEYYRTRDASEHAGLMHASIGGWRPSDIEVVAAFDIDRRKVGHRLEEAVFALPNCARVFQPVLPASDVKVQMGPVLDGLAEHMSGYGPANADLFAQRDRRLPLLGLVAPQRDDDFCHRSTAAVRIE
jgi:myo-inositol-1-phosphate synthase